MPQWYQNRNTNSESGAGRTEIDMRKEEKNPTICQKLFPTGFKVEEEKAEQQETEKFLLLFSFFFPT